MSNEQPKLDRPANEETETKPAEATKPLSGNEAPNSEKSTPAGASPFGGRVNWAFTWDEETDGQDGGTGRR